MLCKTAFCNCNLFVVFNTYHTDHSSSLLVLIVACKGKDWNLEAFPSSSIRELGSENNCNHDFKISLNQGLDWSEIYHNIWKAYSSLDFSVQGQQRNALKKKGEKKKSYLFEPIPTKICQN